MLLMIILIAYPVIDLIPMAGLIGVMFNMIFFHIFDWGSLKFLLTCVTPASCRKKLPGAAPKRWDVGGLDHLAL